MHHRAAIAAFVLAIGCGGSEAGTETFQQPSEQKPAESTEAPKDPATSTSPSDSTADNRESEVGAGGGTGTKPACSVTFSKDVLPHLASSCGDASCHGESVSPIIDVTTPAETHAALMDFAFGSIEWSDPHPDVSGAREPALKKVLDAWRLCGAPSD